MEEMNDVHDFMSRFGRDIEVIWGTTLDNTLGNKVKITILATGFGVEDIPQIADRRRAENSRMSEEELRQEEDRLRKEQEEKDLIDKYYGASGQRMRRASTRAKAVILSTEEMDDDAFIVLMEENPTYSRDPKIITRARSKTTREEVIAPVIQEESIPVTEKKETPENNGPVIRFR
jgi:cell division protein FtsZ